MKEKLTPVLVVMIGLIQLAGHFTGLVPLKGLGAALMASPLPVTFSDIKGLEPFSVSILSDIIFADGSRRMIPLDPKQYGRLKGSYTRRSAYGTALAFATKLPEPLWQGALRYGFCDGPVSRDLKLAVGIREVTFHASTKTKGRDDAWDLKVDCL